MTEHHTSEARARLDDAARAAERTRSATRWYPRYLLLMGVMAIALIMCVEVVFPSGPGRHVATAVWAVAMALLGWWAGSRDVHPERAGRRLLIAMAAWFGTYLFLVGPLVRWQTDESVLWWGLAAVAMASPFAVAAWRAGRAR